ncbi:MocR-like pyridoxine biosynthesis transcription factor PdxR [Actinacidiphila epipremni]|uniref:PLP-dependent aminotransferase family protein n=1 Tax=Actinacidiphila epipremni TaxID=2053013 RepID=A0ABX0ZUN7_9ACTN|nr:PLP-dependent aminotransferase family protein [Actinacidiphila epipremni]NJP46286.1 PLP-dependent aminotransferase family protein [Actinacidiphila epipremni]
MDESWPTAPPARPSAPAAEPWESGVDLHLDLRLDLPPDGSYGRRAGLERALRDAVRQGRLAPGARLPSSRRLAAETGLSRGTVKAAYDQLTTEGYLAARQGSGTVVAGRPQKPPPAAPGGSAVLPPPRYDLRPGSPDVTAFPAAAWLRAARRALAAAPSAGYGYGDPRGTAELRGALAEYLGRTRGVAADPERIVVVSGYVQGLALLTGVLGGLRGGAAGGGAGGGPVVAMEDPGLPFHREVVRRAGGRVVPLPVDAYGAAADLPHAGTGTPDAVVLTPAHQYPTGVTLHPSRRHELTAWARASGGLVVEDDYDGEFRFDRQPVGALQGTAPDHVAYLGTASKTLGPALRLGWMVLPPHLVGPVAEAKLYSDYQTEAVGQLTLAELIAGHAYDRHVRAARLRYRRRRDLLLARIGAGRPGGVRVRGVAAGLQALLELPPDGPDEAQVMRRAAARGLAVGALGEHWHTADGPGPAAGDRPQGLVVGYGTPGEGAYPAALAALARALKS